MTNATHWRARCARSAPLLLALAGGALVLQSGCADDVVVETALRPVRYQEVATTRGGRQRTFAGVARAGTESQLSFRVAGTVTEVPVVVGQRVDRGQLLARMDPADYELQVQEALAARAQAEAAARNAEADYARVRALYENNNASRRELDGARANNDSSRALVEAADKRLEQARRRLAYTSLRAPTEGTIASVKVEINENVQAGSRLFLLTAGSRTEVEVAFPEALISDIRLGQPADVAFDALPGRSFAAEVVEAGVAAVGTATTFPVTVRLKASDPDIRSGMAAEVVFRFTAEAGAGRLLVPAVAVGEDRDGRFVFALETQGGDTGLVRRTAVAVGELTADGLEITSGLSDGDLIVTAGVRRLSDGEEVLMLGSTP